MALKRRTDEKILDVDATMQGTLSFKDPVNLRINGNFEGTLDTKGNLTVGEQAVVNANIMGEYIVIAGKVKGKIIAREKLTFLSTAVVQGEVVPAKLIVSEGAVFEGSCKMLHDLMNAEELSQYLEVDMNSVLEWAGAGKIPAQKESGEWRFERKSIDAWIASGKV
ncbi:MAG: polymer-forming cytoskeletal protein [Candidatus Omnitrophica bacterium]|nr:polymer-forming cytoskeletal protein [Candidatus Omnitrophota bacterium]MDD5654853.1 polymer-forming cytoskeletal protein [Candidatus Omnitrophota bacterium]